MVCLSVRRGLYAWIGLRVPSRSLAIRSGGGYLGSSGFKAMVVHRLELDEVYLAKISFLLV
jgi:hypothetical protein